MLLCPRCSGTSSIRHGLADFVGPPSSPYRSMMKPASRSTSDQGMCSRVGVNTHPLRPHAPRRGFLLQILGSEGSSPSPGQYADASALPTAANAKTATRARARISDFASMYGSLEPSLEVHKRHTYLTLAMVRGFRRVAARQAVWGPPAHPLRAHAPHARPPRCSSQFCKPWLCKPRPL